MKSGIININKPSGLTSFGIVRGVRENLGKKVKVGHAGTLDPGARGVLLLLVEGATKVSGFLMNQEKEYEAKMILGMTTDTHDGDGRILTRKECNVSAGDVKEVLVSFTGPQEQVPPMLSAKKHKGERLYRLFRRGETVKRNPENIEIKSLILLSCNLPEVEFRVTCSKGTYVRTLCNDIGERLGCGAYMSSLVRTRVGGFTLKDSTHYDEGVSYDKHIMPLNSVLSGFPHLLVNMETANGIRNGKQIGESEVINIDKIKKKYGRNRLSGMFPVFDQEKNFLAMVSAENRNVVDGNVELKLLRVMA